MLSARDEKKLADSQLKMIDELGKGEFGMVLLCAYEGNDPAILHFAKENKNGAKMVAVKLLTKEDPNEDAVMSFLEKLPKDNSVLDVVPKSAMAGKLRVMENVAFDESDHHAFNLKRFLAMHASHLGVSSPPSLQGVELKSALNQLFQQVTYTQDQLHCAGILHFDTAPRNFLVTSDLKLKIIDFGFSQTTLTSSGGEHPYRSGIIAPISIMDQGAFQWKAGIRTDIFARKMAMFEMLALAAGQSNLDKPTMTYGDLTANEKEFFSEHALTEAVKQKLFKEDLKQKLMFKVDVADSDELNSQQWQYLRRKSTEKNDEYYLQKTFENVRVMIDANDEPEVRNQLHEVLVKYQAYLTSMPSVNLADAYQIKEADKMLFDSHAHQFEIVNKVDVAGISSAPIYQEENQGYEEPLVTSKEQVASGYEEPLVTSKEQTASGYEEPLVTSKEQAASGYEEPLVSKVKPTIAYEEPLVTKQNRRASSSGYDTVAPNKKSEEALKVLEELQQLREARRERLANNVDNDAPKLKRS